MKINQRLFDHYGIDTRKDLGIKGNCSRPWDTILIDKQGSCYACECTAWLPQSIGNLQVQPLSEIVGSAMHKHLQDSIEDGTYRYCNQHQCAYIKKGDWPTHRPYDIQNLRLAIDDSCNLRCPSCRNGLIFHREGPKFRRGIRLADRINKWLETFRERITVHIGSDGDPFASHVYRHFMAHTHRKDNISYSILTNGLMFKEFHTQVPYVINNLRVLGVSMDGASKETYERLRLGGKWEKIIEGLECMAEQKRKHGFEFIIHFVVQKDNYHEMQKIVDLGEQYGADRVWLNKIEDWNTMSDFKSQDIWNKTDYQMHLEKLLERMRQSPDKFIQCPTLITQAVPDKNKN